MIEEPPLLTIARDLRRPDAEQIAGFQGVPTSFVVDAMYGSGALSNAIRPLGESRDLVSVAAGPALTVGCGAGDILALLGALDAVRDGDIVLAAFDGFQGCAAAGDRVCGMLRNCGAAGFVTDGPVRDYAGIVEVGMPCWATGLTPASPYTNGPGSVGLPIQIGGRQVETGDMIVADHDGVVVVPFGRIDAVLEKLKTVKELETALDAEIAAGLRIPPATVDLLKSDKVKYV